MESFRMDFFLVFIYICNYKKKSDTWTNAMIRSKNSPVRLKYSLYDSKHTDKLRELCSGKESLLESI